MGRIAIVDDEPDIGYLAREILRMAGHQARWYQDPREALEGIEEYRPDVVVLDLRMPVISGFEVAETLRKKGLTMPIIAATGLDGAESAAKQAGATMLLPKPFDGEELLAAVERCTKGACV